MDLLSEIAVKCYHIPFTAMRAVQVYPSFAQHATLREVFQGDQRGYLSKVFKTSNLETLRFHMVVQRCPLPQEPCLSQQDRRNTRVRRPESPRAHHTSAVYVCRASTSDGCCYHKRQCRYVYNTVKPDLQAEGCLSRRQEKPVEVPTSLNLK